MSQNIGIHIARKRKALRLSQRKAASLIEKNYGVKISHSYLSLIERGMVESVGSNLKNALEDFFRLTESGDIPVHRIPLYEDSNVNHLDIAGRIPADFAVTAKHDMAEAGIFTGDILVCRKCTSREGDLVVINNTAGIEFCFLTSCDMAGIMGSVVLVLKKSVKAKHCQATQKTAASTASVETLIKELADRSGLKEIDLKRTLEVLKGFAKKS